jgi:hypothetical protein
MLYKICQLLNVVYVDTKRIIIILKKFTARTAVNALKFDVKILTLDDKLSQRTFRNYKCHI